MPAEDSRAPRLELRALSKRFGDTAALTDVSLTLAAGEVLALVGENGAGKTTLLSLLTGLYTADAGEILVDGVPLPRGVPRRAEDAGIGLVPQHSELVGPLTVAENVVLGREPRRFGALFDRRRAEREVARVAERHGLAVDPKALARELSVAQKQRVDIVRLLWRNARILALDEPTATLAPAESDALLATLSALAKDGRAILLVSHKLADVRRVAQRIAVLRRGRLVATLPGDAPLASVAAHMAGAPRTEASAAVSPPLGPSGSAFALSLRDWSVAGLRPLTLELRPGELLGIAGVDGSGQRELSEGLCGLRPSTGGTLLLGGRDLTAATTAQRREAGLAYLPDDRMNGGLCAALTLAENLVLGRLASGPRAGTFVRRRLGVATLDAGALDAHARAVLDAADVRPREPRLRAGELSGGNQQKLLVARELDGPRTLVVAAHPTRGLDSNAARAVRARLAAQASGGAAVIVFSADLDELRALCQRVAVLFRGACVDLMPASAASDARLSSGMLGQVGAGAPGARA